VYCRLGPFLACVFREKKSQKNPGILSSHAVAQEEEMCGRHGGYPQIKPNMITYYKFMGSINSRHDAVHLFG
jgi:hypothetical protein